MRYYSADSSPSNIWHGTYSPVLRRQSSADCACSRVVASQLLSLPFAAKQNSSKFSPVITTEIQFQRRNPKERQGSKSQNYRLQYMDWTNGWLDCKEMRTSTSTTMTLDSNVQFICVMLDLILTNGHSALVTFQGKSV